MAASSTKLGVVMSSSVKTGWVRLRLGLRSGGKLIKSFGDVTTTASRSSSGNGEEEMVGLGVIITVGDGTFWLVCCGF